MRYSNEHKLQTRAKILEVASAEMLVHGAAGISIANVMAEAGLTHGGFYAHFKSKGDLIAEVIRHTFDSRYAYLVSDVSESGPAEKLTNFIDTYLSIRHRDDPKRGCPVPALASETSRLCTMARTRFHEGVSRLNASIAELLVQLGEKDPAGLASSILSEMFGALVIARATTSRKDASTILAASKQRIMQRLGLQSKGGVGASTSGTQKRHTTSLLPTGTKKRAYSAR
nr:TetR/AcrR family transcriptional regulator [Burkholderia ambifaria]